MKISKETIKRFQEEAGLFLYFGAPARSFMMESIELEQNKIGKSRNNLERIKNL